jgi:uncharacterized protein
MSELLVSITQDMISCFDGDQKRIHHALKVHGFAHILGIREGLSTQEQFCLEAAGYLHDIGIPVCEKKYGSSAGNYQEIEGPPVARPILEAHHVSPDLVERTLYLIGHHHSYGFIDGPDIQLLMEADFLVNMYEDNYSKKQISQAVTNLFKSPSGLDLLELMCEK